MSVNETMRHSPLWACLRWLVWGGAVCLLLAPWVAMRLDAEGVDWSPMDFVVMGIMLGAVCIAFEIAVRVARSHAYVVAAGIAAGTGFLMTWANLAVGIIGDEDNPANLMFFGLVLIALLGTAVARLKPQGMARAMTATAIASTLVWLSILVLGELREFALSSFFVAGWVMSALIFRDAAKREAGGSA